MEEGDGTGTFTDESRVDVSRFSSGPSVICHVGTPVASLALNVNGADMNGFVAQTGRIHRANPFW